MGCCWASAPGDPRPWPVTQGNAVSTAAPEAWQAATALGDFGLYRPPFALCTIRASKAGWHVVWRSQEG